MTTYDHDDNGSNFGLMVFLAFVGAAVLGTAAYWFLQRERTEESSAPKQPPSRVVPKEEQPILPEPEPVGPEAQADLDDPFNADSRPAPGPADTVVPPSPEQALIDAGMGVAELDPEVLLRRIGNSLENADIKEATVLIGRQALNESHLKGLRGLAEAGHFRVSRINPVMEIGELEANRRVRWALNSKDGRGSRLYFDLRRERTGSWKVEALKLPTDEVDRPGPVDALGVTHAFLEAALRQTFDEAKKFVDSERVSDAKIAGLCIVFEEAKYQLRAQKPLRAMFRRDLTSAFIAHVEDASGAKAADFGVTVQRASDEAPWRVTEINLDSLLADYARRVAGGDVHYTPLVKNPTGGDTLILYFGFDEDGLTPRTRRQLEIVAGLLKIDPDKKLTLSGHTDSLGTDQYNQRLSARRADAVQQYLLEAGVPGSQIIAMAEGEAKPRLPNSTADGEDNPAGRRANRRTEIYLDF